MLLKVIPDDVTIYNIIQRYSFKGLDHAGNGRCERYGVLYFIAMEGQSVSWDLNH